MMPSIITRDSGWDAVFAGRAERGPAHIISTGKMRRSVCDTCGGGFFDFGSGRHEPYLATPGGGRVYLCSGRALP